MAGSRIPIISKRSYSFNNGSATIVAVKALDVTNWREGALLVRVHSEDVASSSTLKVVAYVTAPSSEEPSVDFDFATAMATCTINSSTVAPVLLLANLTAGFGAFLVIKVEGVQSGGNCSAVISVELVVKT